MAASNYSKRSAHRLAQRNRRLSEVSTNSEDTGEGYVAGFDAAVRSVPMEIRGDSSYGIGSPAVRIDDDPEAEGMCVSRTAGMFALTATGWTG